MVPKFIRVKAKVEMRLPFEPYGCTGSAKPMAAGEVCEFALAADVDPAAVEASIQRSKVVEFVEFVSEDGGGKPDKKDKKPKKEKDSD